VRIRRIRMGRPGARARPGCLNRPQRTHSRGCNARALLNFAESPTSKVLSVNSTMWGPICEIYWLQR
jgi:hypothetical protein